jgi:hypothetical protein
MMPVPAYWYVLCCQSCQCAIPFPWYGFFMQILAICFYFTTISWNTGQFSTLVTFVSSYGIGSESAHL